MLHLITYSPGLSQHIILNSLEAGQVTEIDLSERELAKAYFDGVGHYSRPDLLTLNIRDEAWSPTGPEKLENTDLDARRTRQLLDLLERYNLTPTELEAILESHLSASE